MNSQKCIVSVWAALPVVAFALVWTACGESKAPSDAGTSQDGATDGGVPQIHEEACVVTGEAPVAYLQHIGCKQDFDTLASVPIDASIPGARSVKVVLDQAGGDALYFQNSQTYEIHYAFVSSHLSGNGLPVVPELSAFNQTEYFKPDRRFILGAVTYYEGPGLWVFELSPYDTASAEMIEKVMIALRGAAYFGPALGFHPTSTAVGVEAAKLPASIRVVTTDEIYAQTTYQPLTLGRAMGRLNFVLASELETEYLSYRDIVVLDEVPNDISVISGLITAEFQTPLSHVNVLSKNRGTPNMALRGATTDPTLRALEGKWVDLTVTASAWTIREVTMEEADAYWEAHRPEPVTLPALDLSVTDLVDIEDVVSAQQGEGLRDALKRAVLAFGGKAAHYAVMAKEPAIPMRKAFAVPVFYYDQFMRENGFYERIDALLADPSFKDDPAVRDVSLASLRADMMVAPVDQAFVDALMAKAATDYPGLDMRFRTSTNSEDLEGFPCAGCYESRTGRANDIEDTLDAIRETWASIWLFRTFEERAYYGVDHRSVGMALLVHHNFPDEEANGVAVTANPYDLSGLEPAFYVNVQWGGEAEVVHPPPGIKTDELLYFYSAPNQPATYLSHSNLVPAGETVLTARQLHELGKALDAVHTLFSPAYGPASGNTGWYAMDVEFKFDDEGASEPKLFIKQARPFPRPKSATE